MRSQTNEKRWGGSIVVLIVILAVVLLGMGAFAVDAGYILETRAEMQRSADAAALAAVVDLIPDVNGNQDTTTTKATAVEYANHNYDDGNLAIPDADMEIGRFDPNTIYSGSSPILLQTGVFDTVRLTLRRNSSTNGTLPLFFATILGKSSTDVAVRSTAAIRKADGLLPGSYAIPFALHQADYLAALSLGSHTILYDENGVGSPGNFGIVDVGRTNNSSSDVIHQIRHGLRHSDFHGNSGLSDQGLLDSDDALPTDQPYWLNTGPGLKANVEKAFEEIEGETRIIPIYDSTDGESGENLDYHVVSWAVVQIYNVDRNHQPLRIEVKPAYQYDGKLRPNYDLSDDNGNILGAYTSPGLFE